MDINTHLVNKTGNPILSQRVYILVEKEKYAK